MEGVRIFKKSDYPGISTEDMKKMAEEDLKKLLSGLAVHLFGKIEMRWHIFSLFYVVTHFLVCFLFIYLSIYLSYLIVL
jgi:hypothetical protein